MKQNMNVIRTVVDNYLYVASNAVNVQDERFHGKYEKARNVRTHAKW